MRRWAVGVLVCGCASAQALLLAALRGNRLAELVLPCHLCFICYTWEYAQRKFCKVPCICLAVLQHVLACTLALFWDCQPYCDTGSRALHGCKRLVTSPIGVRNACQISSAQCEHAKQLPGIVHDDKQCLT